MSTQAAKEAAGNGDKWRIIAGADVLLYTNAGYQKGSIELEMHII